MDLKLSWDLFVIVFFAIVAAYSFIIGRQSTLKIIIGTYIAALSADGLGNIFNLYVGQSTFFDKLVKFIGYAGGAANFSSVLKIIFFIVIIVILTIFGDYEIAEPPHGSGLTGMFALMIIAVLSGGLILSTIIVFANGSFIGGNTLISDNFRAVYDQSKMVRTLLDWHDFWFSMPGVVFALTSIMQRNQPSDH